MNRKIIFFKELFVDQCKLEEVTYDSSLLLKYNADGEINRL